MKMRKELNNKGVSLVELLIATIILGIVVVPLLHTFVTAANTTARSRQIGEATLLGENVAELVETTAMKDLKTLFEDPSFGVDNTDPDNPAISYSRDRDYDIYSLSAKGVHAGSSTFNVEVKLDPTAYRAGAGVNNVKLSDYSNMDGIYAQSLDVTNPDVLAYAAFQREADRRHSGAADGENASGGEEWDPNSVEPVRTTTIDITEDILTGEITAIPSLMYTYHYTYSSTDETGDRVEYANSITVGPYEYDLVRDFSPNTEGRLPNLYVMYYPLYESSRVNDIIVINNMLTVTSGGSPVVPNQAGDAQPIKIFLVKEKAADANLANKEVGYNARVEQYVPAGTHPENYAVVYSNIRENLVTGTSLGNNITYDIYRGSYFSDIGRFGGDDPNKGGDLVSKTERNRMYDVTVEIYDAKDTAFTTPIHTVYATKLQ